MGTRIGVLKEARNTMGTKRYHWLYHVLCLMVTLCLTARTAAADGPPANSASTPATAAVQGSFTPPGPNIALHRPYTVSPAANYVDTADDGDAVQLTDGEYSVGYFWVQKPTVGWHRATPVQITIDLGKVEPIAGLSYSTAAGVADVTWPTTIGILASADGKSWSYLGDLIRLSTRLGTPEPAGYRTYRFVTADLKGAGRYLQLVIDQGQYTVVDEIEVYQGPPSFLELGDSGPKTTDPQAFFRGRRVATAIAVRLLQDLGAAREAIGAAGLAASEKAQLLARAADLNARIEALPDQAPADFKAVLPLNDVHAGIYALNAPLLRARGYGKVTAWQGNRWDNLGPTEAPERPPERAPALRVQMMRNEYRAEAFNLTNPTDRDVRLTVNVTGLPGGKNPSYLTPREVLFTDTFLRQPIAAALPPAVRGPDGYEITVPAGMTRQVWLSFHPTAVKAGTYQGKVKISGAKGVKVTLPLTLQVYPFVFPDAVSIAIGGWDYLEGGGSYDAAKTPQQDLIRCMEEHFINTAHASSTVMPANAQFDQDGKLTHTPDFSNWDRWVAKWQRIRTFEVFLNPPDNFAGSKMGTPRFNRAVGEWVTAWVEHMKAQNLRPGQLKLMILDEPTKPEQDEIILAWTKAVKAAQPGVVVWEDPCHADPAQANQEMLSSCDVLCPPRPRFITAAQSYRDYFVAQQKAGRELAFYSCSGGKGFDPSAYHRGQFWTAFKYQAKGSFFWALCDECGCGNSWNPYLASGNGFCPVFLGPEGTTDAKHMEAIREGAEDYECLQVLAARVAELTKRGVGAPAVAGAKAFLDSAPDEVLNDTRLDDLRWSVQRDRSRMDRARVQALDWLVQLSKL
jgi:hypothetical protein